MATSSGDPLAGLRALRQLSLDGADERQKREQDEAYRKLPEDLKAVVRVLRGTSWGRGKYIGQIARDIKVSEKEAIVRCTRLLDRGWLYQSFPPLEFALRPRKVDGMEDDE